MSLDEIRAERAKLEVEVRDLILAFEERAGVAVELIQINHIGIQYISGRQRPILGEVSIGLGSI